MPEWRWQTFPSQPPANPKMSKAGGRIQAQQDVSSTEHMGSGLLDNLATAVVLLDAHFCILYVNPAAEHLFATSLTKLRGQPVALYFESADWNLMDMHKALQCPSPYTQREARLRCQGQVHEVLVDYTISPLLDNYGTASRLLMELQPLDRLMRISREDSLFAAHHATLALVRGMAHEIKNPLGGIRGAAQLLARTLVEPSAQDCTDIIISETDRLHQLVDRMLGPRRPPNFRPINIHQVLERVRAILQAEVGDRLVLQPDYDPSLPELLADMDQLIQAVLNILRNAAQALLEHRPDHLHQDSPMPRILLRSRVLRQLAIGNHRHRLVCLVEVEDNGPGIDEALRETLFYPMVTGRSEGTGLGLPIAQSIIQQHGGLIECDSLPGRTLFRILIPFLPIIERTQGTSADVPA